MARSPASERLEAVLRSHVTRPRRRQALVVGALLDGAELVRGVSSGGEPVGEATVFEVGSITKVFTGVALASCADLGLVQLDEPLRRLLPPDARLPPGADAVTLAQLASHSSGLPRMPPGVPPLLLGERARKRARLLDVDDLFAALARTRLRDPPGRRYRYSNFAVSLLGHALARRAGAGWADLVQTFVCEPLGLVRTGVGVLPADASMPPGRSLVGRDVPPWDFPAFAPAGALRSTARDLLRFLGANLGDAPAETARRLTIAASPRFDPGGRLQVALGWHIVPLPGPLLAQVRSRGRSGPAMVWHNGLTGGFASFAGLVPDGRAAVVVLASRFRSVTGLGVRILRDLAG